MAKNFFSFLSSTLISGDIEALKKELFVRPVVSPLFTMLDMTLLLYLDSEEIPRNDSFVYQLDPPHS